MPQSLARVLLHITFSTKNREPLIVNSVKERLFHFLGGVCRECECQPIQIGGYNDHVHVLCALSRKMAIMTLVEHLKRSSSKWIKEIAPEECGQFYWQEGYGVFSVSPKQANLVVEYIQKQETHHATHSFREEYIQFLKQYNMDYDECYLWD